MAAEKEETGLSKYIIVSTFYTITIVIMFVAAYILMPVYPEIATRMFLAFILAIAVFFGFATDEQHCTYVYKKMSIKIFKWRWTMPCLPRFVSSLISIFFYILAVIIGFLCHLI